MSLGRRLISTGEAEEVQLFKTVLYTGNGGTKSVTGVGFQPDFVWIKPRSVADNHNIFDSIRGDRKQLIPNGTSAESTQPNTLTSFDSDGFTTGSDNNTNTSGATYVAWCLKAGNSTSTNTVGDIESTVSVNSNGGFSIVSYTGDADQSHTIGHGLSSTPELIIVKNRTATNSPNWAVWHKDFAGTTNNLFLNLNVNKSYATGRFGTVNSTTFKGGATGGNNEVNGANPMIAYCFHSVSGVSKIGSYTGDGTTSGKIITTGFEPSFLLTKPINPSGGYWYILDNSRSTTNPRNDALFPNDILAEISSTNYNVDFLSTGFELKNNTIGYNTNNEDYIYMAFK